MSDMIDISGNSPPKLYILESGFLKYVEVDHDSIVENRRTKTELKRGLNKTNYIVVFKCR